MFHSTLEGTSTVGWRRRSNGGDGCIRHSSSFAIRLLLFLSVSDCIHHSTRRDSESRSCRHRELVTTIAFYFSFSSTLIMLNFLPLFSTTPPTPPPPPPPIHLFVPPLPGRKNQSEHKDLT